MYSQRIGVSELMRAPSPSPPLPGTWRGVFYRGHRVAGGVWLAVLLAGCSLGQREEGKRDEAIWRGQTARIRTLDPARAGDVASALAVSRLYEGLLQYAYAERPYQVEPLLAATLPLISADGLTYTFTLRPGVFFQDDPCFTGTGGRGRELEAADFVFSMKRIADAKNSSSGYWAFRGRIEGLDAFRADSSGTAPTDYSQPVAGLQAVDRYTLQIRLTQPYPQLLWVLTMPYAAAVPREAVAYYGAAFDRHPVGTGPFRLASWSPNYSIEYERNPKWMSPDGATPALDRIIQYVIGDPSTAWLMFLDGRLESSPVSRDNWDAVVDERRQLRPELAARGIQLIQAPTLDLYYIGFNMDDPIVGSNPKLRQALTCAFNTEEWRRFYQDRVTRPDGPIPPGVAGAPDLPSPYPFDLPRARQWLAEAGYPDGVDSSTGRRLQLTLDLGQADNPEIRQSTDLFVQFMDRLGVVVTPIYNNWPTFLSRIERRQVQLFRLSWIADYPDAENFLQLFYSPNASPGSNRTNYRNPAFDRLYEQARGLADGAARDDLIRRMTTIVQEDCPWIFVHCPTAAVLLQPWVQNYRYHDFPYGMDKYYAVEKH